MKTVSKTELKKLLESDNELYEKAFAFAVNQALKGSSEYFGWQELYDISPRMLFKQLTAQLSGKDEMFMAFLAQNFSGVWGMEFAASQAADEKSPLQKKCEDFICNLAEEEFLSCCKNNIFCLYVFENKQMFSIFAEMIEKSEKTACFNVSAAKSFVNKYSESKGKIAEVCKLADLLPLVICDNVADFEKTKELCYLLSLMFLRYGENRVFKAKLEQMLPKIYRSLASNQSLSAAQKLFLINNGMPYFGFLQKMLMLRGLSKAQDILTIKKDFLKALRDACFDNTWDRTYDVWYYYQALKTIQNLARRFPEEHFNYYGYCIQAIMETGRTEEAKINKYAFLKALWIPMLKDCLDYLFAVWQEKLFDCELFPIIRVLSFCRDTKTDVYLKLFAGESKYAVCTQKILQGIKNNPEKIKNVDFWEIRYVFGKFYTPLNDRRSLVNNSDPEIVQSMKNIMAKWISALEIENESSERNLKDLLFYQEYLGLSTEKTLERMNSLAKQKKAEQNKLKKEKAAYIQQMSKKLDF